MGNKDSKGPGGYSSPTSRKAQKNTEPFIQLELSEPVYEIRDDGPPLKGRINLQIGLKNQYNLVELEMIGIEEVRWNQGKL